MTSSVPMSVGSGEGSTAAASASASASLKDTPEYAAVVGKVYHTNSVMGALPPLISVPDPDSLQWEWDSNLTSWHGADLGFYGTLERRHSGWEGVEKQWIQDELSREQGRDGTCSPRKRVERQCGELSEKSREAMNMFPYPSVSIPAPRLESDFRVKVSLSAQTAAVADDGGGDENRFKRYTTYTGGTWCGHFGYGTVVSGGQETQDLAHGETAGMLIEATQRLRTEDNPPAYIDCKARGSLTGKADILEALGDRDAATRIDPRQYSCRMVVTMKTTDERYAEKLNFGIWVGSCYWRGEEIVCDAYRVT